MRLIIAATSSQVNQRRSEMACINATLTQKLATGCPIATIGDQNTYITLTMRRLGAVIELVNGLTIYHAFTGHYEYEELDRAIADDEDEAVEIATDMEYAAADRLKIMDI